jgi:hypothetical protein
MGKIDLFCLSFPVDTYQILIIQKKFHLTQNHERYFPTFLCKIFYLYTLRYARMRDCRHTHGCILAGNTEVYNFFGDHIAKVLQ